MSKWAGLDLDMAGDSSNKIVKNFRFEAFAGTDRPSDGAYDPNYHKGYLWYDDTNDDMKFGRDAKAGATAGFYTIADTTSTQNLSNKTLLAAVLGSFDASASAAVITGDLAPVSDEDTLATVPAIKSWVTGLGYDTDTFLSSIDDNGDGTFDFNLNDDTVISLDITEATQDIVSALIQDGTGLAWTYDDAGNTLTGNVSLSPFTTDDLSEGATNLYFTDERVDDRVAALLASDNAITLNYDDVANTLTIGESHSTLTNNPHNVTPVQVGHYWNLLTGGVQRKQIGHNEGVDFVGGTNISVAYGAGGIVTINNDYTLPSDVVIDNGTTGQLYQSQTGWNNVKAILDVENVAYTNVDNSFIAQTIDGLTLTTLPAISSDTDKFLMSDGGTIKYATGAQVASWIDASGVNYWTKDGTDLYYTEGNVGIGTTTPTGRLNIKSSGIQTNPLLINASDGQEIFKIREDSNGNGLVSIKDTSGNTIIQLHSADGQNSYINTSGVGIGSNDPEGYKFKVAGTSYFTDNVTVGSEATPKDLTVYGNIYQHGGEVYSVKPEIITTSNDFIHLRDGATTAIMPDDISGIRIGYYNSDGDNLIFGTGNDGFFRVGEQYIDFAYTTAPTGTFLHGERIIEKLTSDDSPTGAEADFVSDNTTDTIRVNDDNNTAFTADGTTYLEGETSGATVTIDSKTVVDDLRILATRADSIADNSLVYWDNNDKVLQDTGIAYNDLLTGSLTLSTNYIPVYNGSKLVDSLIYQNADSDSILLNTTRVGTEEGSYNLIVGSAFAAKTGYSYNSITGDNIANSATGSVIYNSITGYYIANSATGSVSYNSITGTNIANLATGYVYYNSITGNNIANLATGDVYYNSITGTNIANSATGDVYYNSITGANIANSATGDVIYSFSSGRYNIYNTTNAVDIARVIALPYEALRESSASDLTDAIAIGYRAGYQNTYNSPALFGREATATADLQVVIGSSFYTGGILLDNDVNITGIVNAANYKLSDSLLDLTFLNESNVIAGNNGKVATIEGGSVTWKYLIELPGSGGIRYKTISTAANTGTILQTEHGLGDDITIKISEKTANGWKELDGCEVTVHDGSAQGFSAGDIEWAVYPAFTGRIHIMKSESLN